MVLEAPSFSSPQMLPCVLEKRFDVRAFRQLRACITKDVPLCQG